MERTNHDDWVIIIYIILYFKFSFLRLIFKERMIPSPLFIDLNASLSSPCQTKEGPGNESIKNHHESLKIQSVTDFSLLGLFQIF